MILTQRSLQYESLPYEMWSGDWITVQARFSEPVQTGHGAHPVFCTMGAGSLSWG